MSVNTRRAAGRERGPEKQTERAGLPSNAGHQLELGTLAALAPPYHEAGAKRALLAAAGKREKIRGWALAIWARRDRRNLSIHRKQALLQYRLGGPIHKEPGVRDSEDLNLFRLCGGWRIEPRVERVSQFPSALG